MSFCCKALKWCSQKLFGEMLQKLRLIWVATTPFNTCTHTLLHYHSFAMEITLASRIRDQLAFELTEFLNSLLIRENKQRGECVGTEEWTNERTDGRIRPKLRMPDDMQYDPMLCDLTRLNLFRTKLTFLMFLCWNDRLFVFQRKFLFFRF